MPPPSWRRQVAPPRATWRRTRRRRHGHEHALVPQTNRYWVQKEDDGVIHRSEFYCVLETRTELPMSWSGSATVPLLQRAVLRVPFALELRIPRSSVRRASTKLPRHSAKPNTHCHHDSTVVALSVLFLSSRQSGFGSGRWNEEARGSVHIRRGVRAGETVRKSPHIGCYTLDLHHTNIRARLKA